MNRISAFTLMEVIIVMIISMIVVSLTYKTLDIVTMQYRQFSKSRKHIYELSLIETLLTKDFTNSEYLKRMNDGVMCKYRDKNVIYIFDDRFIVRSEGTMADTFNIMPRDIKYYFSDKEVKDINNYIDKVAFVYVQESSKLFIHKKVYAADFFLNTRAIQLN